MVDRMNNLDKENSSQAEQILKVKDVSLLKITLCQVKFIPSL